jgi:hypothetical protein
VPGVPPRGIIHEHEFEEQLARLIVDPEQADDFIAAAEEILSVNPRRGMPAEESEEVWYLVMFPVRGRRISLFYTFDEETVNFISIRAYED